MRNGGSKRRVVVGDIHGELNGFKEILEHAGLLNATDDWVGADTILIQTGDVIDRGPESIRSVSLLRKLQSQAPGLGGEVVRLCGNHELMFLEGVYHYKGPDIVKPADLAREIREDVISGHLLACYTDGYRLYSHAGLRSEVREYLLNELRAENPKLQDTDIDLFTLAAHINRIFIKSVEKNEFGSHPIYNVDKPRGGSKKVGGIFWGDYSLISQSLNAWTIPQIFGHTPAHETNVQHSQGLKLINVDAGMCECYGGFRVYLEITGDGKIMQHSRGKTTKKWESKVIGNEPTAWGNKESYSSYYVAPGESVAAKSSPEARLREAIEKGDLEELLKLIEEGTDLNYKDENGWTPLMHAAYYGRDSIFSMLYGAGADLDAEYESLEPEKDQFDKDHAICFEQIGDFAQAKPFQWTSLTIAARRGLERIVNLIVQLDPRILKPAGTYLDGYELCSSDELRLIMLKKYDMGRALIWSLKEGHIVTAESLIDDGATLDIRDDKYVSPLGIAVCKDYDTVVQKLLDYGADILEKNIDYLYHPLLAEAARFGNIRSMKVLLKRGVEVDEMVELEWTALHYAVRENQLEASKLLIDSGADVNLIAPNHFGSWSGNMSPLEIAAHNGNAEMVQALLQAGPNSESISGALLSAIYESHSDVVCLLIRNGADVNDKWGDESILMHAGELHDTEMVDLLLQNGADVSIKNDSGETALAYAIKNSYADTVAVLLKYGADIHAKDNKGNSPLSLAKEQGDKEVLAAMRIGKRLSEGAVDTRKEHFRIYYKDEPQPLALIGRKGKLRFVVQFTSFPPKPDVNYLIKANRMRKEIWFYLVELGERDPWGYAIYHCTAAANAYSDYHWGHFPAGYAESKDGADELGRGNVERNKERISWVIKFTSNIDIAKKLQNKLREYRRRLEKTLKKKAGKDTREYKDTVYKIAILERLLLDGEVNTQQLSQQISEKYGEIDHEIFEGACGVLEDYARSGGKNVRGGTGLK